MTVNESVFDNYVSLSPGLSDCDLRTLRYMLKRSNLMTDAFYDYWNETVLMLKKLFQTNNDLIGMTGTIRVAFDGILGSIIEPGDKILVLSNGYWGSYAAEVTKSFKGIPIVVEEKSGCAIKPEKVEEALGTEDIKAVSIMHVETDTGIVNPVGEIGDVVKKNSDTLYIVDCATSLGGMEVKADEWGAGICFSGSHKCLSSPVGMAFITVGKKAWKVMEERKTPIMGYYDNLLMWKERTLERVPGKIPPPIPVSVVHAVRARLDYIFESGPKKIFQKHEIATRSVRRGISNLGISLLADCDRCEGCDSPRRICSDVVTTFYYPHGVSADKVESIMSRRYYVPLYPEIYRPECFHIGTINETQVNPRHILYLITALGLTMSELGVRVNLEKAIRTANKILLDARVF